MSNEFRELFARATAAGEAAAAAMTPRPMAVQAAGLGEGFNWNKPYDVVSDGVCGFAWLLVRPSSSKGKNDHPFVKWLREQARATGSREYGRYDEYQKGWNIWIGGYGQSMQRKEAHAEAMAGVLREAGINAWAYSRMD